jgi:hypothetical protein
MDRVSNFAEVGSGCVIPRGADDEPITHRYDHDC